MAITKNDCLVLLSELTDKGIDCTQYVKQVIKDNGPSVEVLQFINENRELDLTRFYEKLRKSYNSKKSSLYINIMKDLEEPQDVLTTLNSYTLQVLLFSKDVEDKQMFYDFTRLDEVYKCLAYYLKTFDLIPCSKVLQLIKADIKVLETCYRNKK